MAASDVPALHDGLFADPAVTWDGGVYTVEDTTTSVQRKQRHLEEHGFGMLAVTDRTSGEVLGYAGLQHLEDGPDVELGYYLRRSAWGRGLGTELALALARTAFQDLGLRRIVAVVRTGNDASKHVLAKAGFHAEGMAHHHGEDVEVWAISLLGEPSSG